jgi:hypothetical protein
MRNFRGSSPSSDDTIPRGVLWRTESASSILSPELRDQLQARASKKHRSIVSFVMRYEALIAAQRHPIVPYDTSHGFSHQDSLHPDGREAPTARWGYRGTKLRLPLAEQEKPMSSPWCVLSTAVASLDV